MRNEHEYTQIITEGKFMAFGCSHGNLIDRKAFATFMAAKKKFKPKHMFMLGDLFEFTALRKGATDDEKRIDIEEDIDRGLWTLDQAMKGIKGEKWYLRGNHCERIWQMAENGSVVSRDFARHHIARIEAYLEKNNIRMKPYCSTQGVIQMNNLLLMHGYGFGVNAAKDHLKIYHKDVVFVHTHRAETAVGTSWPRPIEAINCGMMMKKFPKYAQRTTSVLSWSHGFCEGEFLANGTHTKKLVTI